MLLQTHSLLMASTLILVHGLDFLHQQLFSSYNPVLWICLSISKDCRWIFQTDEESMKTKVACKYHALQIRRRSGKNCRLLVTRSYIFNYVNGLRMQVRIVACSEEGTGAMANVSDIFMNMRLGKMSINHKLTSWQKKKTTTLRKL